MEYFQEVVSGNKVPGMRLIGLESIDMELVDLEKALIDLPLGGVRYYPRIGSTNDEAIRWCEAGAPDLALMVADEQTFGRGRLSRPWQTLPGTALAFSLVMYPPFGSRGEMLPDTLLTRLNGLGGLAVSQALAQNYGLQAEIKWPNDVLLERCKVAGVLAEARWQGDILLAVILGIGVNITQGAIWGLPEGSFPATCVEARLGRQVDRIKLLRNILDRLLDWRSLLGSSGFLQAWEQRLAWRGEWVEIRAALAGQASDQVLLQGLNEDGSLRVSDRAGQTISLYAGEISLMRAIDAT